MFSSNSKFNKKKSSSSNKRGKSSSNSKKKTNSSKTKQSAGAGFMANSKPPEIWHERWRWYFHPKRFKDWWFTRDGALAALRIAGTAAGIGLLALVGVFLYFARDLPNPGELNAASLQQTTRFYDRTGEETLYEVFGDQNRTFVDLDDMGENVRNATIAIEDRNFYDQGAFSSLGIIRAAVNNLLNRDQGVQGGSTITQQYVKNALLTPDQTITRKIRELIISMQIEQLFEKDDILELYLNEIGYGAEAYGVQAASQMYFSKDADELENIEAAMLAALPQAPTFYSPYGENTEALINRTDIVIDLMEEQGYLDEEEAEEAREADLLAKVNDTPDAYRDITAPHFVLSVQQELEQEFGVEEFAQGGFEVITTIDLEKQEHAEQAVADGIGTIESGGGNNASLVSADPRTGEVLAMVGSRDFEHPGFGSFNAASAERQPGSSFKPYIYAEGIENTTDWGAGSIMYDVPTDFGNYEPRNFEGGFRNEMTVRSALAESRNITAVKMFYIVGIERTLDLMEDMGMTTLGSETDYGLSLVLGSGEVRLDQHTNAMGTFANNGVNVEQTRILEVRDSEGNVLQENDDEPEGEEIFDPQTAYLISDILSDDGARAPIFGSNSPNFNVPGHTVAVKTGTTDDSRDGWMMGYSQDLVSGVWVGHNDNLPMTTATSNTAGPIFTQYMENALEGEDDKPFERPDGIKNVELDALTGTIPTDETDNTVNDQFPSWYQPSDPGEGETAVIDTVSGDLATDCTPDRAREEITSYGMQAELPSDDPSFGRWNAPVQALANERGVGSGGSIPDEESDVHDCDDSPPSVSFSSTEDEQEVGDIEIVVEVERGTHAVDETTITYNGEAIETFSGSGTHDFTFSADQADDYSFEAEVVDDVLYDSTDSITVSVEESDEDNNNPPGQSFNSNPNNGHNNGRRHSFLEPVVAARIDTSLRFSILSITI